MSQFTFLPGKIFRALLLLGFFPFTLFAQIPEWIWNANGGQAITNGEIRFFHKTFSATEKPRRALLALAADDDAEVFLNGQRVAGAKGWANAQFTDVTKKIQKGANVLAIKAKNEAGHQAGVLVRLELTSHSRQHRQRPQLVVSDTSWLSSATEETDWQKPEFQPGKTWVSVQSFGKLGIQPWGDVIKSPQATRAEDLRVPPGFKVELLRSAQAGEGSWICLAVDPKGRLIISPQQDDLPLFRVTLSSSGKVTEMTPLVSPIHQAMGLCWAHDSLYANAHGPNGTGLYRLIDQNQNDAFETNEVHFLKKMPGEGEHGYHAIVAGPDGLIYVMNGNHTKVPEGVSAHSPHRNYAEDFLLPRQWDAGGHAVGILAPGGYVLRTDPEGKNWEVILAGFRNAYDFDFNADGEIFTFDSDMEWEWGMPWYRPTRILHGVSGGEYGWRSGSAKWPAYYPDSLPATLDIGLGSPTGTKFGTKSNFPEKYRKAFYAMDWSYGRIFAVHLQPQGASYAATAEVFVKGKPLNVTDLEFGRDGAMYFLTGGRGTQAGLYRVSHVGAKKREAQPKSASYFEQAGTGYRQVRQFLESLHGRQIPGAVDAVWPYLGTQDRFLRFAARIALESQPVATWKNRAVQETHPGAGLNALLALARVGGRETQNELLTALRQFPFSTLPLDQKLTKLRVIALSFIRQGKPDLSFVKLGIEKLGQLYPADNDAMNRELCQLLVYLEAPEVVEKTFILYDRAKTQEEQIHYLLALRNLKTGWTLAQREKYFTSLQTFINQTKTSDRHPAELLRWFREADRDYSEGASYAKQLNNIKKEAIASLSENEKLSLAALITDPTEKPAEKKAAKERAFVQEWKMTGWESTLAKVAKGRNFENGKAVFSDAQCLLCHRFGNEGGSVGPELTAAASKYSRRDILEAILDPSKIVSDQFQNFTILRKNGEDETGRIVDETDEKIVLATNPLAPDQKVEIKKSDVAQRTPAKLSPMPEGLLNHFTEEDILDLLAYIESAGRAKADNFKK